MKSYNPLKKSVKDSGTNRIPIPESSLVITAAEPDDSLIGSSEPQDRLEKRKNYFLENHPFICGYGFLGGLALLVSASHLSMFVISFLFLYLISDVLTNDVRRYVRFVPKFVLFSILYILVIWVITILCYNVIPNFAKQVPSLASKLEAEAVKQYTYASQKWNLKKYADPEAVKKAIVSVITTTFGFLMEKLPPLYMGLIYFLFALIINLLLYHNIEKVDQVFARKPGSLMEFLYRFTKLRIRAFYFYFKQVMSGQFIISSINTAISSLAIFGLELPSPVLLVFVVFFCGLFPVVGNLISNTILTITAFIAIGLWGAIICLVLLIVIHKLEYFLNSKIISNIVNIPMVITLTSLVVSEVLLGIVGLMLAVPLLLFIRHEFEHIPGIPRLILPESKEYTEFA